jgi:hypothetical protein
VSARISRRQVLAAITLAADLPEPRGVAFVEADRTGDSPRLAVDLDSIAELRAWLPFFGMTEKRVSSQPYTHKVGPQAGQTTTLANAYSHIDEDWRGWRVHLTATDPVSESDPDLDDATREQLAAIADEPEANRS